MITFAAVVAYWTLIFGGAILLVLDHQERPIEQRKFGETVMAIVAYTLTSMLGYSFLFSTQLDKPTKKEVNVVA